MRKKRKTKVRTHKISICDEVGAVDVECFMYVCVAFGFDWLRHIAVSYENIFPSRHVRVNYDVYLWDKMPQRAAPSILQICVLLGPDRIAYLLYAFLVDSMQLQMERESVAASPK